MPTVLEILQNAGWQVMHGENLPIRTGETVSSSEFGLAPETRCLLAYFPNGLYLHQAEALAAFLGGQDVCLITGTASGKTLAFHSAAIEVLASSPSARVAVFYPLRALGQQQEELWREAIQRAGLSVAVARIDGSISQRERHRLLRQARLLVFTPDVVHAWLLSNLEEPVIRQFLADLRLMVVDEVHSYNGVFGSNAAFLFRRIRQAVNHLSNGQRLRWFCTSATMADPEEHIARLCGVQPAVIKPEQDTSPRQPVEVLLVLPPPSLDLNSALGKLCGELVQATSDRFLAFVDSRRQVETLAVIANRGTIPSEESEDWAKLQGKLPPSVLPYRSGYEEADRAQIQQWLQNGQLRGVRVRNRAS